MSFRDFKEEIFLVLEIKEGHGFGFATNPLVITANLAGNVHESFVIEPCPQPKFENVFVWVMDKTKMKSIWSDKVPVRVECNSVLQPQRSRIGYLILNVKDAQIIKDESKIVEKQSRLLGLSKEGSISKPELIYSFFITDSPISSPKLIPQFWPPLEGKAARVGEEPLRVTLGSGRDHFILAICVVAVNNLRELLPSQSEVEPELLTYTYSLLGAELVSDAATNHSVRLKLTSSLACLKTYCVRQPSVTVQLSMGSLCVGETSINLQNLLLSDEVGASARRSKQQSRTMCCRCLVTPTHNISETPLEASSRPSVDFSISLAWEVPVIKKKSELSLAAPPNSAGAGGDADRGQCIPLRTPLTLPLSRHSPRSSPRGGETYRTQPSAAGHTVQVSVTSLHTEQTLPHDCWLRLNHPSASVTPPTPVALQPSFSALQWQLTVTLPPHLLESTLSTHPPCLQLGCVTGQLIATTLLHPPHNLANAGEVLSVLERDGERVGEVGAVWTLVDVSSQTVSTLTDTSLSPPTQTQAQTVTSYAGGDVPLSPRTRELKILNFVEELEDWAEKQRIMVMEGLKDEEAARLAALQSQWESEVGGQVVEGRQLVEALHSMRDRLRQHETDMREREHKLKMYKEDLERVHRIKLQEFKDLSRRMQDEFNHKLTLIAGDKVSLEREVEQLKEQNVKLKQSLREVDIKADANQQLVDSVMHEQKVLKEKLQVEQESKEFFKEHCRKAEQEIHRLNMLRQEELAARMKTDKERLEQLAFEQIICERQDLRQDQDLLEEIRQQLQRGTEQSDINFNSNRESIMSGERLVRKAKT